MNNNVEYPDCPFCGNSSLSIVDVIINELNLKSIKCNNPLCSKYIGFFQDETDRFSTIKDKIDDLESNLESVEGQIDDLKRI